MSKTHAVEIDGRFLLWVLAVIALIVGTLIFGIRDLTELM
jgi:hypothetical protein